MLLAMVLLPLVATLQTPRPGAAQSTGQDSLWAGHGSRLAACASPSSAASLAGCFSAPTNLGNSAGAIWAAAADSVNVYFATQQSGAWSCPIADLGANCRNIMAGPWPGTSGTTVTSLAAADGQIWFGQTDGNIYRCPANIPYASQSTVPGGCVLLDAAGTRAVESLLLANGRLYAGLSSYGPEEKKQGILWSCDPQAVNSCENLDYYGQTWATSLVAGGGYLWAALENGIIWRCNLDAANACANWETAGNSVSSISWDGQGTLYAAVQGKKGVVWSCPAASANQCSSVIGNVNAYSVAAGSGSVFSSTADGLNFGTSAFAQASSDLHSAVLLHVPAEGAPGVGGVSVTVRGGKWTERLGKRCSSGGKGLKATVQVTGPHGLDKTQVVNLCRLQAGGGVKKSFTMLDPGEYTVTAWTKKYAGSGSFTVEPDQTGMAKVRLTRAGAGK